MEDSDSNFAKPITRKRFSTVMGYTEKSIKEQNSIDF